MEDNSKVNRRSRPRPYDLRRKVLLKNFLREQMTYIPHARLTSYVQNSDTDFSKETSNSSKMDENLIELNDENNSSSDSCADNSSSTPNIEENSLVLERNVGEDVNNNTESIAKVNATDPPAPEAKFFRFSSIMNLRSDSRKKKAKGILKAKKVCKTVKSPVKTRSFKTGLERLLSGRSRTSNERSSDRTTRSTSKSLFSLFKSRKEQRKAKTVERTTQSSAIDVKSTNSVESEKNYSSNRSVQTDDSWARKELLKVEQSNKLLREENRLLSESLSYFMSSNSLDSQLNHCSSPLQSSNRNMNGIRRYSGCYDNLSSCSSYGYEHNWNPRSRILRSKSVQEHNDRSDSSRYSHRTRSMNYHNNRRDYFHGSTSSASAYNSQAQHDIPHIRKKNVLACLPVNSTGKVVQRRSSMPERILSENGRSRMCRRSGSVRDTRTPFHSLPSEAFY